MKFIKVGSAHINPDHVSAVEEISRLIYGADAEATALVHLSGGQTVQLPGVSAAAALKALAPAEAKPKA